MIFSPGSSAGLKTERQDENRPGRYRFIALAVLIGCFLVSFALVAKAHGEWPVIGGLAPSKTQELVTISAFASDSPNGTPYRIALRDVKTRRVLDSFLWNGDVGDPQAHNQSKSFWSPDGRCLVLSTRAGRLSVATTYFLVENGKLFRMNEPNIWEKIRALLKANELGSNRGISPLFWIDRNHLKIVVIGDATNASGRSPFQFNAILEFSGGNGQAPLLGLKNLLPDSKVKP